MKYMYIYNHEVHVQLLGIHVNTMYTQPNISVHMGSTDISYLK